MDKELLINKIKSIEFNSDVNRKKYSVLVPIIYINNNPHILFELRAFTLKTQPSEVSFPGGKVEKNESFYEAALRETSEELNIPKKYVEIIKEGNSIISPYNFILKSFIGIINYDYNKIFPNKDEVHEIFTVSIEDLTKNPPEIHFSKTLTKLDDNFPHELIPQGKNYKWREGKHEVYFYKNFKHVIWGMTAKLTKDFIEKLNN